MAEPMRILSLGAGVQSTCLLHMSLDGEIEPLGAVIFADTGWEPKPVYENVSACEERCRAAGVPFYRVVRQSGLKEQTHSALEARRRGERGGMAATLMLPAYVASGEDRVGMMRRYCTSNYKTMAVDKAARALHRRGSKRIEMWIGISMDELERLKICRHSWMDFRYPLAWDLRMTRTHCIEWLRSHGYEVPMRSACVVCPYKTDQDWLEMRAAAPQAWAEAVAFDTELRLVDAGRSMFLHSSGEPLAAVDMSEPAAPLFGWINECDGFCGV